MTTLLGHDRALVLHTTWEERLPTFGDKTVGIIATDPPYGQHTHANLGKESRSDGARPREALTFEHLTTEQIAELAYHFVRLSQGWILVFTDDRTVDAWGTSIERAGGRWVRTGHWVKTNPMPQMSGDRPSVGTEPLVIAHAFPPGKGKMQWRGRGRAATWRGPRDTDDLHPNQKPLWLMQELLGLFAPPNAIVLDPFCGSGSTGVAALSPMRYEGLKPLDLSCTKCTKVQADRLEKVPLPERLSFVGLERDSTTALGAAQRIAPLLEYQRAA